MRGRETTRDIVSEVIKMDIDFQKLTGLNPEAITEHKKKKADFFSENIVNLEKKDYSALSRSRQPPKTPLLASLDFSFLTDLSAQLPKPVTLPDKKELDEVCKYSHLRRFFVKEIALHNELLAKIREDLAVFASLDAKEAAPEQAFLELTEGARRGKVPPAWVYLSTKDLPLVAWMKRLLEANAFFARIAAELSRTVYFYDIRLFADPKGLLHSYLLDQTYKRAPSMKFDDVITYYRLTTTMPPNSSKLPEDALYVFGLKVRHAYVDRLKAELTDKYESANCLEDLAYVAISCRHLKKPSDKNEPRHYICPVLDRRGAAPVELFRMVGPLHQKINTREKSAVHNVRGTFAEIAHE